VGQITRVYSWNTENDQHGGLTAIEAKFSFVIERSQSIGTI
jgi:hypothetical protein